jgi:hypothetical protein
VASLMNDTVFSFMSLINTGDLRTASGRSEAFCLTRLRPAASRQTGRPDRARSAVVGMAAIPRRSVSPTARSRNVQARDGASNDQPLDFRRAFEDRVAPRPWSVRSTSVPLTCTLFPARPPGPCRMPRL